MVKTVMIIVKYFNYGGAETYTLNLVNKLARSGVSVILVSTGGLLTPHVDPKVKTFTIPIISNKKRIKKIAERRILEIAAIYKPQLIHTQCRITLACTQLARQRLNIPVVTHEHRIYNEKDYPFIVKLLNNCADKIITIGPYAAKKISINGGEEEKITVITNGVNVKGTSPVTKKSRQLARKSFGFDKSNKVAVCISRIESDKGIEKLVLGFIKVVHRIPEARLIIVGDDRWGVVKPVIIKLIRTNHLEKKILILPGQYNLQKYHAVADVFCYPSIAKGLSVMEAMAVGLPVIGGKTTRKPLVVEDNISGLMTEPKGNIAISPDQITEKLIYIFNHPRLAKRMGLAARKRIEKKFDFDQVFKKVLNVYQELIDSKERQQKRSLLYSYGYKQPSQNFLPSSV